MRSEAIEEAHARVSQRIRRFQRREVTDAFQDPEGRLGKKTGKDLPKRTLMLNLVTITTTTITGTIT